MKSIEIQTIPKLRYAHSFSAENYKNRFSPAASLISVSYIHEGAMEIYEPGQKYIAQKGDIQCFLRHAPTHVRADSFHCHHTFCVHADWKICDDYSGLILPRNTPACEESKEICDRIDEFLYNRYTYEHSSAATTRLTFEILCKIDEIARKTHRHATQEYSLIAERAKKYIHDNLSKQLKQKDIAHELGVSPEYLCAVFKKSVGIPLIKYINNQKLTEMKFLMDKEKLHLYEVTAMYGYSDANYVSALYKKMFGRNITEKINVVKR